jgi:hypothetical protein
MGLRKTLGVLPSIFLPVVRQLISPSVRDEISEYWFKRGWKSFRAGRFEQSAPDFIRVHRLTPDHGTAAYYAGSALEVTGGPWQAFRYFRRQADIELARFGEKSAGYATSLHNLSVNSSYRDDHCAALAYSERAVDIVKSVVAAAPENERDQVVCDWGLFSKMIQLAAAQYRTHNFTRARDTLFEVAEIRTRPDNVKGLARAVQLFERLSRRDIVSMSDAVVATKVAELCRRMQYEPDGPLMELLSNPAKIRNLVNLLEREARKIVVGNNPRIY